MSNTEPLDTYLTHVKVHFVHTLPVALPINRESGALKWGSDLKGGKVKHHSTWGLWDNSGVKWSSSSSHSCIGARLAPSCDRLRKSLGQKHRKPLNESPFYILRPDNEAFHTGMLAPPEPCMITPGAPLPRGTWELALGDLGDQRALCSWEIFLSIDLSPLSFTGRKLLW